ncbi:uncharacterized protein SRS1_12401 [Sporisorium reilianum f. sp. reilianum]|uniref:Uncharacterized protein n=1 Tax=Sporisorium reilianum f. sp. reilianum TaxID=72559 RepID=A0A2N8U8Y6_9BASI|nr:uncharacterized protein SRS1_12401 [Sporisorium reilianum f. sp. reilianum]
MIGPRCLGSGGSALRSSAARSLSVVDAASLTPPLAECSYRIWQPPQPCRAPPRKQASATVSRSIRCFSSAADAKRAHTSSPHTSASVDQHGIESALHDPPFIHAKVKRLRPVSPPTSDLAATDIHDFPSKATSTAWQNNSDPYSPLDTTPAHSHTHWSPTHPPDRTLAPPHLPSRSQPTIPIQLLVDFLTSSAAVDEERYQHIKAQLPPHFYRIDAYLMLRELDPHRLSTLCHFDVFSLVKRVGKDDLAGVLALILEDIIGTDMSNTKSEPGYFQIHPGTQERYNLLRAILVRCNSGEYLLHNGAILNVFMLMLHDLIQLRQSTSSANSKEHGDSPPSTQASSSTQEGTIISIPTNFPVGETLRLVELAVHLHSPELAPIVNALRAHLEAHTTDFPSARQGAQLIAYYLQPNLRDFAAALDVVRALKDTNALPQEVVEDAVRDGKSFLAALEAAFSSATSDGQSRPSDAELQQICMDVSLRLIAMKCVMAHRPKGGVQYRKAFESLMASFRLDLLDGDDVRNADHVRSLLDVPFRSVRNVFTHLVGQNDKGCLFEALCALQRCDQRLLAMLPNRDLQHFCDAASTFDAFHLATETYTLFVKAKTSAASTRSLPPATRHFLARDGLMTDADTFLDLMGELLSSGQRITVVTLLRALHLLPLTDAVAGQLNLRFGEQQRSRLVALLAEAGLTQEAFELFQLWSHRRYEGRSNDPSHDASSLRKIGSIHILDPLIERQVRLMHDTDRQFSMSTSHLVPLVRNLCHTAPARSSSGPLESGSEGTSSDVSRVPGPSSEQLDKARFVIEVFRQACTPIDWTHYRLTSLAAACFTAKDVAGAFDAFAKIIHLRRIPDKVDVSVLLRGLVEVDADKAVELYIQHCSAPPRIGTQARDRQARRSVRADTERKKLSRLAPMTPTPQVTTMLIARVLAQNRLDLVEKLIGFSKAVGLSSRLGDAAALRALFSPNVAPSKVTRTIHRTLQRGWTADIVLVEKLAQRLLERSARCLEGHAGDLAADDDNHEQGKTKAKRLQPKKGLELVQAATRLMKVSARSEDVVNLRTTSQALTAIHCASARFVRLASAPAGGKPACVQRSRGKVQEEQRLQWIACLDSIVYTLRWTKFFDKGDDYRQSLPLWKAGSAGDGELVSVELDDMLDYGFHRGAQQQTRAQASAAAAATLPTSSAAKAKSNGGLEDDLDDAAVAPTHGVVWHRMQRPPNVLPAYLFCRLIESYLALGDASGAAEVASWMRDEAKLNLVGGTGQGSEDFVRRIKAAVQDRQAKKTAATLASASDHAPTSKEDEGSTILRMLAGQQSTARTKRWWSP